MNSRAVRHAICQTLLHPYGIGFLTVYILALCCGSFIGGTIYDWAIRPALPKEEK